VTRKAPPKKPSAKPPAKAPAKPRFGHGGARANAGGARPGAGRKRAVLPAESIARLKPPPVESPLLMARWWSTLLGELAWLVALGQVGPEIVQLLKSLAGTAGRLVPEDLRGEVAKQLAALDAAAKPEAQGPKLEEQRGHQPALRGVPR
jgi:hypothetical protein